MESTTTPEKRATCVSKKIYKISPEENNN